jgi:hypothetical protein
MSSIGSGAFGRGSGRTADAEKTASAKRKVASKGFIKTSKKRAELKRPFTTFNDGTRRITPH